MEEIYNKWQLTELELKKIEPVIFTKEELLDFANYHLKTITVTCCCEELKCEGCKKPLNGGLCGSCCSDLASGMYQYFYYLQRYTCMD